METPKLIQKMDESLGEVFDTPPMKVVSGDIIDAQGVIPDDKGEYAQVDSDAEFARSNMYGLLHTGQNALEYALEVAKSSESPRAFEVASALMKNLADMNAQLLDLHKKKQEIKRPLKTTSEQPQVVNNSVVFQGSTKDLNQMLSKLIKES